MERHLKQKALPAVRGAERGLLSDMGGRAKLSLLTGLLMCLVTMGFLLVLNAPVQAFVTKAASCSATTCHGATNAAATITTSINGTVGTSITLPVSSTATTIEVDWFYTNMLTNASRFSGTSPEIAIPANWTIAVGTANTTGITGWSTAWNALGGASWNTTYDASAEFPNSPQGFAPNYNGTSWDNGTRHAATDDGTAGKDLDGTANRMGADARITIPANTPAGTYTIMVLGIGHDAGNSKAHVERAITVTLTAAGKTTPTINTWPTASAITYGQALSSSTLTGGSASVPGTFAWINLTTVPAVGAPAQAVRFTPTDTTNYNTVDGTVAITVNPKPLTITAAAKSKVYGSADPALTYTATGLVGSDTTSGSLTRAAGENVGTYAINQGTVTAGANYTITYVGANLTVTAKPLTITAAAKSKVYGAVDPALTYTTTGLVGSDTTSGSLTRVTGENAGTYAINQGSVTAGTNYTITYVGANLTINPAPLTITADAKSKVYGSADPSLTYTATGLIGSDTTSGSLTRVAGENAGNYAINQGSVTAGANYNISYTGANLTISPAPLSIVADAKSKVYGSADPNLTYVATGLLGSDTLNGSLTRVAGESVGNYAINQGTLTAGTNYTATYTGANLSISAKPLSIVADAKTKVYGAADPALTYVATGLVGTDTLSGSLTRVAGENVGNYTINQGTLAASSNYTTTYTGADLSVTAKPLAITADAKSKVYGAADPALTFTATGLVGSDTTSGSLTRAAGENVGNYAINQGTVTAGSNYSITYTGANLSVTAKPLAITADAKSKVYGAGDPALTFTATGLVGSDTTSGSLTRAAGENVGSYAINQGTVTAGSNYSITYTSANLSVTAKPLAITADAKSKVYGAADPALTYVATGLVGSDTLSGSLARVAGENVGSYAINQGTLSAGSNYTATYTGANLSVSAKPLTIVAAAKSKVYGSADPALTFTATGLVGSDTPSGSLTRVAGENVGTYAINQGTVTAGSNYSITYTSADLSITTKTLAIVADAKNKVYGSADPALTFFATGLVGSDTTSGSLTRITGETVGSYAINQGTVTAGSNYSITYSGANLSVTAKPLAITAAAKTKVYGSADPALTYTATGLVGSDTTSGSLTRAAGETVGNYAINQGTVTAGSNYSVTYTGANLSVTPAPLTVTADNKSRAVGAPDPVFTAIYSGFVSGDTAAVVSGAPTFSTTATPASPAGTYPITPALGTLAAANYTFTTFVDGTLTITAAAGPYRLTVSVAGSGSGSVHSNDGNISCTGTTGCSYDYPSGTPVTLTVTTSLGSVFAGWSGACTGTGDCNVTMDAAKDVTATFNTMPLARIGIIDYPTFWEAYTAAVEGAVIKVRDITVIGGSFNLPKTVTFDGGYDESWVTKTTTPVTGSVTFEQGTVTVDGMTIE